MDYLDKVKHDLSSELPQLYLLEQTEKVKELISLHNQALSLIDQFQKEVAENLVGTQLAVVLVINKIEKIKAKSYPDLQTVKGKVGSDSSKGKLN